MFDFLTEAARWAGAYALWANHKWTLLIAMGAIGVAWTGRQHVNPGIPFSIWQLKGLIVTGALAVVVLAGIAGSVGWLEPSDEPVTDIISRHGMPVVEESIEGGFGASGPSR